MVYIWYNFADTILKYHITIKKNNVLEISNQEHKNISYAIYHSQYFGLNRDHKNDDTSIRNNIINYLLRFAKIKKIK